MTSFTRVVPALTLTALMVAGGCSSNTSTHAKKPAAQTAADAVPMGTQITVAKGWAVTVRSSAYDGTEGREKVAVTLSNVGTTPDSAQFDIRLSLVSANGVTKEAEWDCPSDADIPADRSATLQPGGHVDGTVCFVVDQAFATGATLLGMPQLTSDPDIDRRFFQLA